MMNWFALSCGAAAAVLVVGATACATAAPAPAPKPDAAVVSSLAPSGRLRVAINLGNAVLAQKNAQTGQIGGVSVVLAQELGKRLGVPVDMTPYPAAGQVFAALEQNAAWDVAFLANEPERAQKIDFSPPYVMIESTYLVRDDSPFRSVADVDRPGVRIGVARGAAYDLILTRTLKDAQLFRVPATPDVIVAFKQENLQAAAGVRQALNQFRDTNPGLRVLNDSFSRIDQAIAVPKGREAGARYVAQFIEEMKASGVVKKALVDSGQGDATVAPPAR